MTQVLQNLLYNAINYTPINSTITIVAKQKLNEYMITISDNGNGIPENEMPFIFDKFYRLPNTKTGGSGLGLSIVKGFVEAHHGQVKVENNAMKGAIFTITIPSEISYINNLKNE